MIEIERLRLEQVGCALAVDLEQGASGPGLELLVGISTVATPPMRSETEGSSV